MFNNLASRVLPIVRINTNYNNYANLPKILVNCQLLPSSFLTSLSPFSTSSNSVSSENKEKPKPDIKVTFIRSNGQKLVGYGRENENLLDVVINNHLDIDGFGACEGTLACSTCHLIFKPEDYEKLNSKPTDEELDMLDLAYGLTETSRLGCQVHLKKDLNDLEVYVPETVNDARTS